MYIVSMASLFKLRAPRARAGATVPRAAVPVVPRRALAAAVVCLATMVYYNLLIAGLFVALGALGGVYFALTPKLRERGRRCSEPRTPVAAKRRQSRAIAPVNGLMVDMVGLLVCAASRRIPPGGTPVALEQKRQKQRDVRALNVRTTRSDSRLASEPDQREREHRRPGGEPGGRRDGALVEQHQVDGRTRRGELAGLVNVSSLARHSSLGGVGSSAL